MLVFLSSHPTSYCNFRFVCRVSPGRLERTVTQHLPSYAVGFSRAVKGCDKGGWIMAFTRILETDD